jgi:hypothetical protein
MKKHKLFHIVSIFIYTITLSLVATAKDCNLSAVKSSETQSANDYSINLKHNSFATVYIDDEIINPPKNLHEVEQFLEKIKTTIMGKTGDTTVFKYGDELQLTLKLPYLGKGNNSVVFSIINDDQTSTKVFKLNVLRGNKGLVLAQREIKNYAFWSKYSKNNSFSIAELYDYNYNGLYHIKKKNTGISLADFLVNKGLFIIKDKKYKAKVFTSVNNNQMQNKQVKKVMVALSDLLHIITQNPSNPITISPYNIFIEFENDMDCIKKIELIEYGHAVSSVHIFNQIKTFDQYLYFAELKLNKVKVKNIP